MSSGQPRRPRLLLLSMYPLDRGLWGPTVRITNIRDALSRVSDLDVVAGWRSRRARALWGYWRTLQNGSLDGVYVEASTTLPGPADLAFLVAARRKGIPVVTFIRDAYPIFAEYADASAKGRLRGRLFRPAFRALARASNVVAFPSQGLADVLPVGRPVVLLPPGAPRPVRVPRRASANQLLHVGSLRHPDMGAALLVSAVEGARHAGHDVELTCVARPDEEPPGLRPPWLRIVQASGSQIHQLLPEVFASVIPRRRTQYNDLAVPIKVMEYLSYGRPTLVTDCLETAKIVREAISGLVVDDTREALALGIGELRAADSERLDRYSDAAHAAAAAQSWDSRAALIVDTFRSLAQ